MPIKAYIIFKSSVVLNEMKRSWILRHLAGGCLKGLPKATNPNIQVVWLRKRNCSVTPPEYKSWESLQQHTSGGGESLVYKIQLLWNYTFPLGVPYIWVGAELSVVTADGMDARGIVVHFPAEAREFSGKLDRTLGPTSLLLGGH